MVLLLWDGHQNGFDSLVCRVYVAGSMDRLGGCGMGQTPPAS